jgi:quinohemoprotein amine dehydrogenase
MPASSDPAALSHEMRQVMWISPDQQTAEGRWFWGEYQEFGVEVKMTRAQEEATLIGADRFAFKTGAQAAPVRLIGDHLPASVTAADLDFGSGVSVRRIVSHNESEIVAELDIAADAVPGKRDISLRRAVLPNAIAIYDRVD